MNNETHETAAIRTVPMDRAIPNGFDLIDYMSLISRLKTEKQYAEICFELGKSNREKAHKALREGHPETARLFYLNATAAYRVGQYTIIPDNEQKSAAYRMLVECYSEAGKLYEPVIEKLSIPYKGGTMEGWLRMPERSSGKLPVVISIGGADGWREEHHNYSNFYAERGLAYLMIDGPGQGETRLFNKMYMELDNETALNEIINFIHKDARFNKIGMIGYSFGGYLAARTASVSHHLDACVINGGSYCPAEILSFLPHFKHVFAALSNKQDQELTDFINGMSMEGYASNISCPLLINHGIPDPIFSWKGVQRIFDEAKSENKTIKLWDDGNHCVTNHSTEVITMVTDWFSDTLSK